MAYTLHDLAGKRPSSAANGAGLVTNSPVLQILREGVREEIGRKFKLGEAATITSAATRACGALEKSDLRQAMVEGRLLEHAVAGSPVRGAILDTATRTSAPISIVQAVLDRLVHTENIELGQSLRLASRDIPELEPDVALRLANGINAGVCKVKDLHENVNHAKAILSKHPFVHVVEDDGTLYAVFEPVAKKTEWLKEEVVRYVLRLRNEPASNSTLLTMMTSEPAFPEEYLATPDFIPDYLDDLAGKLHKKATNWRLLLRRDNSRVSLLGERVIATRFGTPFTSATCGDYDTLPLNAEPKKPEAVWTSNRRFLMQGVAYEILLLGRSRDEEPDVMERVDALVDLAGGRERDDAVKVRDRLEGGQRLSDTAILRIMSLAGARGLMGTNLASHYRLYEQERRAR